MSQEEKKRNIDKKLAHLSEEELKKVMRQYFGNNVPVGDIVKRFRIDIDPGSLYKILPPIQTRRLCEYCGEPLYRKVEPRNQYRNKYKRYDYFCLNCGHEVFEKTKDKSCNCENCRGPKETEDSWKRELIKKHYTIDARKYSFGHLNFEDQIALLYLIKKNKDVCRSLMIPVKETPEWTKRLDRLIDKGYITVSPDSDINAFKDCEEFPRKFYTYKVKYDVNVEISAKERRDIAEHIYFSQSAGWAERLSVFKEYIYEDLLRVFDSMMREKCIDIEIEEKTKKEFKGLVDKITYGEILFFFEKVRKHCLEKIKKGTMTEQQAKKYALTNVVKFYEGNVKNNWKIYKREFQNVGEELMFFIETVFDGDLKVLEEVPAVGCHDEKAGSEAEVIQPKEVHSGRVCSSEKNENLENYMHDGADAEKFVRKLCQIWILCLPQMRFGELMVKFLNSLDCPCDIEDDALLEEFRKFCAKIMH